MNRIILLAIITSALSLVVRAQEPSSLGDSKEQLGVLPPVGAAWESLSSGVRRPGSASEELIAELRDASSDQFRGREAGCTLQEPGLSHAPARAFSSLSAGLRSATDVLVGEVLSVTPGTAFPVFASAIEVLVLEDLIGSGKRQGTTFYALYPAILYRDENEPICVKNAGFDSLPRQGERVVFVGSINESGEALSWRNMVIVPATGLSDRLPAWIRGTAPKTSLRRAFDFEEHARAMTKTRRGGR